MELRQLQAFVAVATELHFGRAAQRLTMAQPTVSELVSRLERELGAPLLVRTSRRVALTPAGTELLHRATTILADLDAAARAVSRVVAGTAGTVSVGMTPPVAPVLGPHLAGRFAEAVPGAHVEFAQLWLPTLLTTLIDGDIDVALTCGVLPGRAGVTSRVVCAEPLLVGLRADHPLATQPDIMFQELAHDVFGRPRESLFPAWALAQRQVLAAAGIDPPSVDLEDTDLAASRWFEQSAVTWVLLAGSRPRHLPGTALKPLRTGDTIPYSVLWRSHPAPTALTRRFIETATTNIPDGWHRAEPQGPVESTGPPHAASVTDS